MSFYFESGYLFCEDLRVTDIQEIISHSPFYLYSTQQINWNYVAYKNAFPGERKIISYAVKANGNLSLLKKLNVLGSWATLVSANEIRLAKEAGFSPDRLIYNGNGKTLDEIRYALQQGTFINIDSEFDFHHIRQASQDTGKRVKAFLRITPDVDPGVHPYISTGLKKTKFGIPIPQISTLLSQLRDIPSLDLVGLHCHLGSTIEEMESFKRTIEIMVNQFNIINNQGFQLNYLNIGGGLGIDYHHLGRPYPGPDELAEAILGSVPKNTYLIIEPGRSLIGDSGILVCKVIGVKSNGEHRFIIVDAAMTELIRPSLYQAYHHIDFIQPVIGPKEAVDIVGPVCESSDFLGKNRCLALPPEGTGLAVFDTGAYGYAMSSNYNARLKPPEYLVDGSHLIQIRKPEHFDDLLRAFPENKDSLQ